jgi:hypothetical protein
MYQRVALTIVNNLGINVVGTAEDVEARSFGCSANLGTYPNLPPLSRTQISSNALHFLLFPHYNYNS